MATLYRQYRPQNFSEVVNQQHIRLTLEHALEHDRVAHAYLFTGPRGVGKTSVARILARAVNCTQRGQKSEPCNTCPNCLAILANRSLDIIEIDAASQTGVDNVRENIIQSARATPGLGRYKVFIIDEVHMLSLAAFNALLKILEEPPAHAMFILATTEVHRVPETIISRTQRFDFKKIQLAEIVERLQFLARQEQRQLDQGVPERIARQSGGSLRDAESMLGQLFSFQEKRISQDIADLVLPRSDQALVRRLAVALVRRQATEALNLFHAFCQEGGDIQTIVVELIAVSRGLLLGSVDPGLLSQSLIEEDPAAVQELADVLKETSTPFLTVMVERLLEAQGQLHRAVMMELPVEVAIVSITGQVGSSPSPLDVSSISEKPAAGPARPAQSSSPTKAKSLAPANHDISVAWQKLQATIGQLQPSLALSVQQATIATIDKDSIHLKVPFKLHAERLMNPKHRGFLEDKLQELIGRPVKIEAVYDPAAGPSATNSVGPKKQVTATPPGDLWDTVVANFN